VLNMAEWNALNGAEILPGFIICVISSAASDLPDDHAGQTLVTRSPHVFSRRRRLRCCKACPLLYRVFCACLPGISLISLWYTSGQNPVSIKWVAVRDPKGELRTEAFFVADLLVLKPKGNGLILPQPVQHRHCPACSPLLFRPPWNC